MPPIVRYSLRTTLTLIVLAAAACRPPFIKSADERKAACDRSAAAAIQTSSLEKAKHLAAEASACYAKLQAR